MGNITQSVLADMDVINAIEAGDYQAAGVDSESILLGGSDHYSWVFTFGTLVADSIMKFFLGNTVGAKTTAIAWSYRMVGADFKAAAADTPWGAATAVVAGTGLSLVAGTFDHRLVVVEFSAAQLGALTAVNDYHWLTCEIDATATTLLVGAIVLARGVRYAPTGTQLSTA